MRDQKASLMTVSSACAPREVVSPKTCVSEPSIMVREPTEMMSSRTLMMEERANDESHERGVGRDTESDERGKDGGETMPTGEEVVAPIVIEVGMR